MTGCTVYRLQVDRLLAVPSGPVADDLARHLDSCHACRERFDRGRVELDPAAFGALGPRQRERMLDALAGERAGNRGRARRYIAAAAIAATIGVGSWYVTTREAGVAAAAVGVALVEDHIRYLGHPDREQEASRPALVSYLRGYVDFPVSLPELPGARLTGARRCYLLGRRVALGFYDTPGGPVSYFALPGEGLEVPRQPCTAALQLSCSAHDGYHVVSWREAGILRALVGPDGRDVTRLALAVAGQAAPTGAE